MFELAMSSSIEHATFNIEHWRIVYIRNFPSRARIVAFKSVSDVDVVRSTSASATASSNARISWARLMAAPLCARMLAAKPIEEDNLPVEQDDRDLGPRFVVNGRAVLVFVFR